MIKKITAFIVCILILTIGACGCTETAESSSVFSAGGITAFDLSVYDDEVELCCGEKSNKQYFSVESSGDFSLDDIEFISENENIANVAYESISLNSYIYYTIEGIESGETNIYFQTKDGTVRSEKIKVTVKQNISGISLADENEITIEKSTSSNKKSFSVDCENASLLSWDDLTFVSENPSIATIEADKTSYLGISPKYIINALQSGETYVYIQTANGTILSNKLKIIVEEKEIVSSVTPSTSTNNNQYTENNESTAIGTTVYITPTGEKYHYSASCAGKNATPTTLDRAKISYDPCKKCAQ